MISLSFIFVLVVVWLIQRYYHEETHKEFEQYKKQAEAEYKALKEELDATLEELKNIDKHLN